MHFNKWNIKKKISVYLITEQIKMLRKRKTKNSLFYIEEKKQQ